MEQKEIGKVWLVGAGPGDYNLLTLKAREVIEQAEVIVYDALVSLEILCSLPNHAKKIDVGKRSNHHTMPQEEINRVLVQEAKQGARVVRLKGGDPFVFGRGGEEVEELVKEQIPYEIVPGITSAVSVPAYAGIPVTHRDYTSSLHIITGHRRVGKKLTIPYEYYAKLGATLIFLMGIASMEEICNGLIDHGLNEDTPAAVLERGTTAKQRKVIATVGTLKKEADKARIQTPAIFVIGKVCHLSEAFQWVEKQPLAGLQVLVTRPKELASKMTRRLRELGAHVVELPAIQTIHNELCLLEDIVEKLDIEQDKNAWQEQWLVFTSPSGVKQFFDELRKQQIDLRRFLSFNTKFAVNGPATQQTLLNYGIIADIMPKKYNGEELGKQVVSVCREDASIMLIRAEEGNQEIIQELKKKVNNIIDVPLYRTEYRKEEWIANLVGEAIERQEIDYVTFTSASTVKGFVSGMKESIFPLVNALCIGEQTAKEAAKYGMKITVAEEATIESMIEHLITTNHCREKGSM